MRATVVPLYVRGQARPSPPIEGHISITREPGGRLGQWARTAILFERDPSVTSLPGDSSLAPVRAQLHDARLSGWDESGIVIVGIEREYRRKDTTEFAGGWFVPLPSTIQYAVFCLRREGERLAREQVQSAPPLTGRMRVAPDAREQLVARLTTSADEPLLPELHAAQLQHWDRRGWVIAGREQNGFGRRLEDPWQAWFVKPLHP